MSRAYRSPQIFKYGPEVDVYLAKEGAVAQAVDNQTIFLSSSLFRMNAHEQRLIVLHELAHLEQFARRGNDPTRSLEDEAWEAAYAWNAGKRFRIRGRAKGTLNALAIIEGGDRGHPSAPSWYQSNPVEPIGNKSSITVTKTVVVDPMTIESIFDAIIEGKDQEVVIVCHGIEDGLLIPFVAGSKFNAVQSPVLRLASDHQVDVGGAKIPAVSDKDVAPQISEDDAKRLRMKMNKVRAMQLKHVAFRACDMGKSPGSTLAAYKDLFGAKSVSAPDLLDSYGQFKPLMVSDVIKFPNLYKDLKGVKNVQGWLKVRRGQGYRAWADHEVGFGYKHVDTINYQIESLAASNDKFAGWVRAHVAQSPGSDNTVVYHGMEDDPKSIANPNSAVIYFIKDEAFVKNIVYYDGSM